VQRIDGLGRLDEDESIVLVGMVLVTKALDDGELNDVGAELVVELE